MKSKYKNSRKKIATLLDDLKMRLSKDEGKQSLVHAIKYDLLETKSEAEARLKEVMEGRK
jgi:hypothetical protein